MPKSSIATNSIDIFGSEHGLTAPRPKDSGSRLLESAAGGDCAGFSWSDHGDSLGKGAVHTGGPGTDSNWFLVKCLPLEMDDYHRGASQVLRASHRLLPSAVAVTNGTLMAIRTELCWLLLRF